MYTEEKKGFPLGNFILKLILIVIFVFLLVWLLPKFLVPAINKANSENGKSCIAESCDTTGISALTSQIFIDNLNRMKEAAISYYTEERLPQEVGQSDTMTLSDMIGKKLLVPLIDKNNKACDVEKSYVKITKLDDEYLLKVNLKDSEKEDYILVHLGCYNYCESYVCQKQGTDTTTGKTVGEYVAIKGSKDNGTFYVPDNPTPVVEKHYCVYYGDKYYDKSGNVTSRAEYIRQCTQQPPEDKHYCVKYNNNYYDKNGNVVSEAEYKRSCGIEDKHYCVKYNNNFYDKNGNVVSEAEYKKSCGIEDKHYCVKYNNNYYDKDGNIVTEEEYKTSCGIEDKHYCVEYNGEFYDYYGKVVTEEEYKISCGLSEEYLYEYSKTTGAKFSEWTSWSNWDKTDCATQEINCGNNDVTCLKKLQILKRKEEIGTYENTYARTRDMLVQTGSYTKKTCSKYNYVIINNVTYATTTTTTYTQINTITTVTQTTVGRWVYNGRASYSNPPSDTPGTHYKFVGADYSHCNDTCTTLPNYYYDSYTYSGGMTKVSTTVTPGEITSTTETNTEVTTTEVGTEASCGEYITATVPVYSTITVTEKAKRTEPLYGTVCYQSTKTRNLLDAGKTTLKWSIYNDTELLENGWAYTGNVKLK